jgi:hypothetical protein
MMMRDHEIVIFPVASTFGQRDANRGGGLRHDQTIWVQGRVVKSGEERGGFRGEFLGFLGRLSAGWGGCERSSGRCAEDKTSRERACWSTCWSTWRDGKGKHRGCAC